MSTVPEHEVDAGAQALRERMQAGKRLNDWATLPNSTKRKWREHAECVLTAAALVRYGAEDFASIDWVDSKAKEIST